MSWDVGCTVGAADGKPVVGVRVDALPVGNMDGSVDGASVDGIRVGADVEGVLVGDELGLVLGAALGEALGTSLGIELVGEMDGETVVAALGAALGALVPTSSAVGGAVIQLHQHGHMPSQMALVHSDAVTVSQNPSSVSETPL